MAKITVFSEKPISDVELINTDELKQEAENIQEERLRSEDIDELAEEIIEGETFTPPTVKTEQSNREMKSEPPEAEVRVKMPVNGDVDLLKHPSYSLSGRDEPFECEYANGTLSFTVEVGDRKISEVNSEIDHRKQMLSFHPEQMAEDINSQNNRAKRTIKRRLMQRKEEIKSEEEKLEEILNPDENNDNLPQL